MRTPCSKPMLAPCGLGSTPPALCSVAVRSAPAPALPCGQQLCSPGSTSMDGMQTGIQHGAMHSIPAPVSALLPQHSMSHQKLPCMSAHMQPCHSTKHRLQRAINSSAGVCSQHPSIADEGDLCLERHASDCPGDRFSCRAPCLGPAVRLETGCGKLLRIRLAQRRRQRLRVAEIEFEARPQILHVRRSRALSAELHYRSGAKMLKTVLCCSNQNPLHVCTQQVLAERLYPHEGCLRVGNDGHVIAVGNEWAAGCGAVAVQDGHAAREGALTVAACAQCCCIARLLLRCQRRCMRLGSHLQQAAPSAHLCQVPRIQHPMRR